MTILMIFRVLPIWLVLTAVVIGVCVFAEPFTAQGAGGILLIVAAVTMVVLRSRRQ